MKDIRNYFELASQAPAAPCIVMTAALAACGGGGGAGGVTTPPNNTTVEGVLQSFGIDTTPSPRVDDDGNALPDADAPLGGTRTINKFA